MEQNIIPDKPIHSRKEDRFQRYHFSKKIAQRIIDSTSNVQIVAISSFCGNCLNNCFKICGRLFVVKFQLTRTLVPAVGICFC
jgi:hypothetical protein